MDSEELFNSVRTRPFGGSLSQSAVDGLSALVAAFDTYGDGDERKLAYILGTAFHECDRFRTMEEYASGAAYEGRKDLGNTQNGDGRRFKGRGFFQLTGRANYADWSARLDMDLIANPGLVKQRDIAARICVEGMMLGTFTGHGLSHYISDDRADYQGARRVVNGTDRASMIAGYAAQFLDALDAAGYGTVAAATPIPTPRPEPVKEPTMPTPNEDLSPVEQSGKAVGAGKWTAVAGAVWTVIVSFDVLPPELNTAETSAAILTLIGAIAAAVGAYRASDKRFTGTAS